MLRFVNDKKNTAMMRFLWIIMFVFAFTCATGAQQHSDQAVIEFDGDVVGDETGAFTVSGNVRFTYDDIFIQSESLILDEDGQRAEFFGNVRVHTEDDVITGSRFIYYVPEETSILFHASGSVHSESLEDPLYYRGESMIVESDRIMLRGAMFTTCDCETPGFYLVGSQMEIVPGHYMTIHHVRFIESGIPLFYWPRLTIPLNESTRPPFRLPQIGHNSEDGFFVKASLPYGPAGAGGGFLHLDWFELKGIGSGVTHYYRDDESGLGELYAYVLANKATRTFDPKVAWRGNLETERWTNSWQLEAAEEGWVGARERYTAGDISLSHRYDTGQVTLRSAFERETTPITERYSISGRFNLNQQLPKNIRLRLSSDVLWRQGIAPDRRLFGYRADVTQRVGIVNWSLRFDESFNTTLTKEGTSETVPWRTVTRRPEATIQATPTASLFGLRLPFTFELGYANIAERRREGLETVVVQGERTMAGAELRSTSIPVGRTLSLAFAGGVQGYVYDAPYRRLVYSATQTTTYRPTQRLSFRAVYEYTNELGESMFRFDATQPRARIRGNARYNHENMNVTLNTGYDIQKQKPEPLRIIANAHPVQHVNVRMQTAYNTEHQYWDYVIGAMEIGDEKKWAVKLGGKYSIVNDMLERIDGALQFTFGHWNVSYEAIYNGKNEMFDRQRATVLTDLGCDCRQIGVSFQQSYTSEKPINEIWLEYRISAIPSLGLRIGSDDEKLMFNLDGWEELAEE